MSVHLINLVISISIINGVYSVVTPEIEKLPRLENYSMTVLNVQFRIALIADLENGSKNPSKEGSYFSYYKLGSLTYNATTLEMDVQFDSGDEPGQPIYSEQDNTEHRGFELSELTVFLGRLLAADDQTGLLYYYQKGKFIPWKAVPISEKSDFTGEDHDNGSVIELDTDGTIKETVVMPIEWVTSVGKTLYVGPNGREGVKNVALVEESGATKHINFENQFDDLKKAAEVEDGYLTHEACVYSEVHKRFFFLPKKSSRKPFTPEDDLNNAANILLTMKTNFSDVRKVADISHSIEHKDRGYSSFTFIPGTDDTVIVALQTSDVTNETYITAFTINGHVVYNSTKVSHLHYEGVAFV